MKDDVLPNKIRVYMVTILSVACNIVKLCLQTRLRC